MPSISNRSIHRYRPRLEGLFAPIERSNRATGEGNWRSLSRDNGTTLYGKTKKAASPIRPTPHTFSPG
jgi:Salmonella virulence plasmid 65kDa B protein